MEPQSKYEIWHRTDPSPGLKKIYVLCDSEGAVPQRGPKGAGFYNAQCATMERLPFMMKMVDLKKRYAPENEHPAHRSIPLNLRGDLLEDR